MKSKFTAYIALFIGVFALSTSAIFARLAQAPSSIIAFYRLFLTAIILFPFLIFNKEAKAELRALSKKDWLIGILSGVFLSMHYVLWFESLRFTSVASSTVIVTLQPIFSIVGGYFLFNERVGKKGILGALIAIGGCFVIGWGDFQISSQALFGDVLAFIAAGIITAYFLAGQHLRKKLSAIPYSLIGYVSSSIFLAAYSYIGGASFVGYDKNTWYMFIGIAIIATILGQFIFNWLLKWLSTTIISMSIMGESIGAALLSYFIIGEAISFKQGIGIVFILIGIGIFLYNSASMSNNTSHNAELNESGEGLTLAKI